MGGGYRTRRGLERQIYWTTWVLVGAFLVCSIANIWVRYFATGPFEWAWRSLSYLKLQPFRLRKDIAVTESPAVT